MTFETDRIPMRPLRSDIAAVVLAGGFGTRIRHLLPDVPKPMAMVAGRPFLEHGVRYLATFGVSRVILSTGYLAGVIEDHFAAARIPGLAVSCVREAVPLGTAGGFLQAARGATPTPDAWLVMNGDSLVFSDLGLFIEEFQRARLPAAILGLRVDDAARFGTLEQGPDGTMKRFAEKRPGPGLINAGVYLFRPEALREFPDKTPLSFETEVFPSLLQRGIRVLVRAVEAPFLDIGTPESLAQAEAFILANQPALI